MCHFSFSTSGVAAAGEASGVDAECGGVGFYVFGVGAEDFVAGGEDAGLGLEGVVALVLLEGGDVFECEFRDVGLVFFALESEAFSGEGELLTSKFKVLAPGF